MATRDVRRLGLFSPDDFEDPRSNPYADEPADPPPDGFEGETSRAPVEIEVEPPTIRPERGGGAPVAKPPASATATPPEPSPLAQRLGLGRMVPLVPGRPAAAPPARSPLTSAAGGAAPAPARRGDALGELLASQRHDALVRDANSVGDALYGAFTRTRPAAAPGTNLAGEFGAREAMADKELAREKAARLERTAAIDADPASDASRASQALVNELLPGFLPPETVAKLSKAQLEKMLPVLKEIEAKRTDRTFTAGEHKLDRDLKRELEGARQRASADKAAADKAADALKLTGDLRKEFNNRPAVKNYNEAALSMEKVERAANAKNSGSDLALIYGLMKLLDAGVAVQEGDKANAEQVGKSAAASLVGIYNQIWSGAKLTDPQREEMRAMARSQFGSYDRPFRAEVDRYRGLASKNQADPDDVAADPTRKTLGGKSYIFRNGDWYEE